MRVSLSIKLAALAALDIGTFLATPAVFARFNQNAAGPMPPRTTTDIQGERDPMPEPVGHSSIAQGVMHRIDARAIGQVVNIKATASIRDSRPNMRYIWSVRVLDPGKKDVLLFEKLYDQQIVVLPANQETSFTFEDAIQLPVPRGTYPVEIAVFMLPPQIEPSALRDPRMARSLLGPRGEVKVSIGE